MTGIFSAVGEWLRQHTDLPLWWSEFYPVPCHDYWQDMDWTVEYQMEVYRRALEEASKHADLVLNCPAQANDNCVLGAYNDTSVEGGGYPTPLCDLAKEFNQRWSTAPLLV